VEDIDQVNNVSSDEASIESQAIDTLRYKCDKLESIIRDL